LRDSFAHARPFWWYAALLPILMLPWSAWPALWRTAPAPGASSPPRALLRFGLCAFLPALLLFSLVSGKQPHYLFPALGGLALLAAARLSGSHAASKIPRIALLAPALVSLVYLSSDAILHDRYDLEAPARALAAAQAEGRRTAFFNAQYHGQFHFLGRLHAPVDNPGTPKAQRRWLAEHPDGLVAVVLPKSDDPAAPNGSLSAQSYGSRRLELWRASDLAPLLK
jgi:4-amino-4-deoxy-L-arabinose transferase-like glycosyltransferase